MIGAKNVLLIAAAIIVAPIEGAFAQQTPSQHLLDSLQEITGVPGMSAAVSENHELIWTGSAGMADIQQELAINDQTKFRIASVSKLYTAALVLRLAEDGVFDLDADIRTYVPEWPNHGDSEITLRQLAAHISGISHYSSADLFDASRPYRQLTDSISIYGHKPLLFDPGGAYSYSSYGYALMGAAVESVTDRSFDDAMDKYIFGPLELQDTFIENAASVPPETATLYSIASAPIEIARNNQHRVRGATGMLSTPSDLLLFAEAFASGAIVSGEMRDMAWEPAMLNNGSYAGEARYHVGFGWRTGLDWDGRAVVHHAGVTPGARSILSINKDTGTAVAFLSSASWTSRIETTGELIATAATEGARLKLSDCPAGAWTYEGMFIEDEILMPASSNARGRIDILFDEDLCHGKLQTKGAIADWLIDRRAPSPSMNLTLVARRKTNTKVFAMASPWGAFPLRFTDNGGHVELRGDIAGRTITLKLSPIGTIEN